MRINELLSEFEYSSLFLVVFVLLIFSFIAIAGKTFDDYNKEVTRNQRELLFEANEVENRFTVYTNKTEVNSFFLFLVFIFSSFTIVAMYKQINYLYFSLFFIFLLFSTSLFGLFKHWYSYQMIDNYILTTAFLFALLFWQSSILFRMLKHRKQIKNKLP